MKDAICFLCDALAYIVAEPEAGARLHVRCPNCREYLVVTTWLERTKPHDVKASLAEMAKTAPEGMMLFIDTDGSRVVERSVVAL